MNKKIEQYYMLIYKVMNDLHCNKEEEQQDELFFHGLMGLYNGIKTYNPNSSAKEMTYYYVCIRNAITCKFKHNTSHSRNKIQIISLETPVFESLTIKDIIKSDLDLEQEIIKQEQLQCIYKVLNKAKNTRFKQYILDYYGIGRQPLKIYQIALKYGVDQHNVGSSIKQGIKRLKKKVKREYEKSKKNNI